VDWKKTKSILIMALLVMNLLLAYNIYFKDDGPGEAEINLEKTIDLLKERSIDIDKIDYRKYKQMPKFGVSKVAYTEQLLDEIRDFGYELFFENGVLNAHKNISDFDKDETEAMKLQLLEILVNDQEQMQLTYDIQILDRNIELYNQVYDENVFDDGFVRIEVTENESIQFQFQWLSIEGTDQFFQGEIYPIEKSVLSLIDIERKNDAKLEIISYEVVYRVNQENELLLENLTSSEPKPYWRAISLYGKVYYFSGLR
jgi:regulatory protein YycI of two-component signal transduction system YycFG